MASLVSDCPEAELWLASEMAAQTDKDIYGHIKASVIWSDARDEKGNIITPFDPAEIVAKINQSPLPLQHDHDAGRPLGKVLQAAHFRTRAGASFVAAVLGFYDQKNVARFETLGIDVLETAPTPLTLPSLPENFRLVVEADPKEVSSKAISNIVGDLGALVQVERRSHNSADVLQQVLAITALFTVLVWNPFVKTIAEEAGKDAYKAARDGLKQLIERAGLLNKPLVEIHSHQGDCTVSFIIRGKGKGRYARANASLSAAALQARRLIDNLLDAGVAPVRMVYEFGLEEEIWSPSFVELSDGRLLSDSLVLIAVENLPVGLSLGLSVREVEQES